MPSYTDLSAGLTANFFTYNLQPGLTFGTFVYPTTIPAPPITQLDLSFSNAGGAGTINRVAHVASTLTNATPGTTDTLALDLKTLTDPLGIAITDMVKLVAIATFNFANDDVSYLTIGPGTTNPFTSMFSGTGGVIVGPGFTSPRDGVAKFGVDLRLSANASAYAVGTTNKAIKFTSGSSPSLPFRSIILGRTA